MVAGERRHSCRSLFPLRVSASPSNWNIPRASAAEPRGGKEQRQGELKKSVKVIKGNEAADSSAANRDEFKVGATVKTKSLTLRGEGVGISISNMSVVHLQ